MSVSLTVYVMTPDLERLRRFYERALGAPAGAREGNWVPFALGGATFALHAEGGEAPEERSRVNLSFGVDDIEASLARFEAAGAKMLRGVADEAYGRSALVEDPDGRRIELVELET